MKPRNSLTFTAVLVFVLIFLTVSISSAQNGLPSSALPGYSPAANTVVVEDPPGTHAQDGATPSVAPDATTYSLRIPGVTLRPRANNVSYTISPSGGCIYATAGDAFEVWNVPLTLPPGTRVSSVRFYFYDNTNTVTQHAFFTRYGAFGNLSREAAALSVDGGNGYADMILNPVEVIDYDNYSYALQWRPNGTGSNTQLCGFQVVYQLPAAAMLPLIRK